MSNSYFDDYKRINLKNGSTTAEQLAHATQQVINGAFNDSPTVKTVKQNDESIVVRVTMFNTTKSLTTNADNYRTVLFKENTHIASVGDTFEFDNSFWLCFQINKTSISSSCSVVKCNNTLKIAKDLDVINVPCHITKEISLGIHDTQYVSLPDNQINIIISNNELGKSITYNQRFIINSEAYKVINKNDITQPGLLLLKLQRDEKNQDVDNLKTGVANAIEKEKQENKLW